MKKKIRHPNAFFLIFLPFLFAFTELHDPTKPPVSSSIPHTFAIAEPMELMATFVYPYARWAIINGKMVKIGDRLDEFTITTITPYTVELHGPDDSKMVLQLVAPVKVRKKEF